MKLFSLLFGMIFANPMMNFLLMDQLSNSDDSDSGDSLLMMMMMSPGLLGGNQAQAEQMNPLLPLMLMDESGDDNTMMLMMMMMQNPNPLSLRQVPGMRFQIWKQMLLVLVELRVSLLDT